MEKRCYGCMRIKGDEVQCAHCGYLETSRNDAHQLPAGTVICEKYLIGRVLGQGGFGITYLGWDLDRKIPVAIKEYYPTSQVSRTSGSTELTINSGNKDFFQEGKTRFLKEAQTLGRLSHLRNIVQVQGYLSENNTGYIIMEYIEGVTLQEHIRRLGRSLTPEETFGILRPIIRTMSQVHQAGMIHRDISPDNIMLQSNGMVKILDFGTARAMDMESGQLTHSTQAVLKRGFAPMEQYSAGRAIDQRADEYALCATIYYCLTGQLPPDVFARYMDQMPIPWNQIQGLQEHQIRALEKGTALKADDRFPDLKSFEQALFPVREEIVPQSIPVTVPAERNNQPPAVRPERRQPEPPRKDLADQKPQIEKKQPPRAKRNWIPGAVAGVLLLIAVVLGIWWTGGDSQGNQTQPEKATMSNPRESELVPTVDEDVVLEIVVAQYTANTAGWWKNFEEAFEKANPRIDLKVEVLSWNDITNEVSTRIDGGNPPDILNIDDFSLYQENGLLLGVEEWSSSQTRSKMYPSYLDQSAADGTVWALPYLAMSWGLYYNADILDAAGVAVPTTWSELRAACEAIQAFDSGIIPWGVDMTTTDGAATFASYTWNNGGGFTDDQGNWYLNSPENVEAIAFLTDMTASGLTNDDPAIQDRYQLMDLFAAGKVAMMIGPNFMSSYCDSNSSIRYGIAPLPGDAGGQGISLVFMDRIVCFDNGYTDAELAAISAVIDAFYDDGTYAQWMLEEEHCLPVTSTGAALYAEYRPAMAAWTDILPYARFYPTGKEDWADVKLGVVDALQQSLWGEDAQRLLDDLQAKADGR